MKNSAAWLLACCLLLSAMVTGCAPSAENRLAGTWVFWHSGMMDGTEAQRKAVFDHNLERYGIVFDLNPDGTLKVTGAEKGDGTWKVVNSSGDKATVEMKIGDKTETVDVTMHGDIAIEFQREGQDTAYIYCHPLD